MKVLRGKLVALLGVAVFTCATVGVNIDASAAEAAAALNGWASSWADVPTSSGTPLVSGVLDDGSTPSVGAVAVLFAEPSDTDVPVGSSLNFTPLSRTTTDANGNWSLAVPAGTDLSPYVDSQGDLNLEVQTFDGTGSDIYFVSAVANDANAAHTAQRANPDLEVAGTDFLGKNPVTLLARASRSSGIQLNSRRLKSSGKPTTSSQPSDTDAPDICTFSNLSTATDQTQVGYTSNFGDYATVTFTYEKDASSTLGVGISATGAAGSWTASGSVSKSGSVKNTYGRDGSGNSYDYYTYYQVEKEYEHCVSGRGPIVTGYFDEATNFVGTFIGRLAPSIAAGDCGMQGHGQTVDYNNGQATTFSTGLDTASEIGISLSAQTGYGSSTDVTIATGSEGHPLCGVTGPPGDNPGLLQVHASIIN